MSACVLYHFPFDPGSRTARLVLGEARIEFAETVVRPWEDGCPVATLNPSGMPPVLPGRKRVESKLFSTASERAVADCAKL